MFDSDSRVWSHVLVVLAICLVFIFGLTWIIMQPLEHRAEECESKNGFMVKTLEGFRCIDKNVLK